MASLSHTVHRLPPAEHIYIPIPTQTILSLPHAASTSGTMPRPGAFMPASTSVHPGGAGRGKNAVATTTTSTATILPSSHPPAQLTLSTRHLSGDSNSSATRDATDSPVSPTTTSRRPFFPKQVLQTDMSQNDKIAAAPASGGRQHHKLHKRKSPSSTALSGQDESHVPFHAPFAAYESPQSNVGSTSSPPPLSSSVPKIKPYLRKMSATKEDQGMIDLSKSTRDNDRLAGLGIQDFGPKTIADVSFTHSKRGQQHGRNISSGSNNSTGSQSYRATQTFVHPMAKTPRPYTPPSGISYANSLKEEEANESDDVVEDDFPPGNGFRSRRSTSVSSTPQMIPTPLSQSHTASELGLIPKLTSTSQSNLSLTSNHSDKSAHRKARPRRNTDLSQEYVPSPTTRTSLDKAFSLVGRRSDPAAAATAEPPPSRDDLILAARRKFEEKEAHKDRKYEQEASRRRESEAKREERQRKQSDAAATPPLRSALRHIAGHDGRRRRRDSSATVTGGAESEPPAPSPPRRRRDDGFRAWSYEDHRPTHSASLPTFGTMSGESEKPPRPPLSRATKKKKKKKKQEEDGEGGRHDRDGRGWRRFSTWCQTRMLSCGGSRA